MPGAPAGGPPHSAPSTAVSSTRNSPPGSKPSQASPAASRPGQNGTPQASAPPAEMRDALVNTFAPEGSHPPPMGRDQLLGDLVRLLQVRLPSALPSDARRTPSLARTCGVHTAHAACSRRVVLCT